MLRVFTIVAFIAAMPACSTLTEIAGSTPLAPSVNMPPLPAGGEYVITGQLGGNLAAHAAFASDIRAWGSRTGGTVRVTGDLASAGVLYALNSNTCIEAIIRLGFHRPSNALGVQQLISFFSPAMRDHFLANFNNSERNWMNAPDFVALEPQARLCE